MKFHLSICLILISSILILGLPFLFGKDKPDPYIRWKNSRYASGYRIQIKNQKGIRIVDEKVKESEYSIRKLPSGKYQIRVGALSPFNKPAVWTKWKPLEVKSKEEFLAKNKAREKEELEEENLLAKKRKEEEEAKKKKQEEERLRLEEEKRRQEEERKKLIAENRGIHESCKNKTIPIAVIKECKDDFIVLDLSSKKKKTIYSLYILQSNNRSARIQTIRSYQNNCKIYDPSIEEKLEYILRSSKQNANLGEKEDIKKALESFKKCKN